MVAPLEPDADFIDRITFRWLNPLINLGIQRPLELNDSPGVHEIDKCKLQTNLMEGYIKRNKEKGVKNYLLWTLVDLRKGEFILCSFLKWFGEYLDFANPIFLSLLLDYSNNPSVYSLYFPWYIVIGMISCSFIKSITFAK